MRGFREVGWVAAVAGTALGCYMVSLKVASERAALEQVENRIVLAQRDIRVLQTEIGTRGRLEQLESWNVKVLALSAPQAQQFLEGEFQLATLAAPTKKIDPSAPIVLASAPAPAPQRPALADDDGGEAKAGPTARDLMQVASYKRETPQAPEKTVDKASNPKPQPVKLITPPAKPVAVIKAEAAPKAPAAKVADAKVAAKADTRIKAKTSATPSQPKDAKARQ